MGLAAGLNRVVILMKLVVSASFLLLALISASGLLGQTPTDTDPVLQGSAMYSIPQSAIDAGIDGTVVIGLRIEETGIPSKAVLISGPMWPCGTTPINALEDLSSTLTDTMMKLRFAPAVKNGKAVAANISLRVNLKNPALEPKPAEIDPTTGKPKPKLVSGGVLNGKALYLPKPFYPVEAKANRDAGSVAIQILIDEEGKVIRAGAVSGASTLQYASREAACGAKFAPTTLAGERVKVSGVITYNFVP